MAGGRSRRKKEGLFSALFGGGRREQPRPRPREKAPERDPIEERRRILRESGPVTGNRRPFNIDISLGPAEKPAAPKRQEPPARPAAPQRPAAGRPAPQPKAAARPSAPKRESIPEPYRSYYASLPKKPYYPVAVPLKQEEAPAEKEREPLPQAGPAPEAAASASSGGPSPEEAVCYGPPPQGEDAYLSLEGGASVPAPPPPAREEEAPPAQAEPAPPQEEPPLPEPEKEEPAPSAGSLAGEALPPESPRREEPVLTIWELLDRMTPPADPNRPAPLAKGNWQAAVPGAAEEAEPPAAPQEPGEEIASPAPVAAPEPALPPEEEARPEPLAQPQGEEAPARRFSAPEEDDWDEADFFTNWDMEHFPQEAEEAPEQEELVPYQPGDLPEAEQPLFPEEEPAPAEEALPGEEAAGQPGGMTEAEQPLFPVETTAPAAEALPREEKPAEPYRFPPESLLEYSPEPDAESVEEELNANGEKLIETLQSFGVRATMLEACRGPAVTRYELQPAAGVKISKITNLADDIALNLAASGVRIEAPIPGKAAVGIEVPNRKVSVVRMRELLESAAFRRAESPLTVALGRDIAGELVLADLAKMPHLLIAGSTGSGKSVCVNSMIVSLLYKATPDEVRFLMVDPKVVELGVYNGIPHLMVPVVTDPRKAAGALGWAVTEMLRRYQQFAENNVRDLASYNKLAQSRGYLDEKGCRMAHMPRIVIIIDELADLMMAAPNEVEDSICRLAQMARAAGMHLVIATQRPSVDVITGIIKANIPSRIAFAVSSQVDSRTILDAGGAEKLLGRGDMLYSPLGVQKPMRVQGCFVSDGEIEAVTGYVKQAAKAEYDEKIMEEIEKGLAAEREETGGGETEGDPMIPEAVRCVAEAGQASTSLLQRRLRLGYARAGRLIDELEQMGVVGPHEGSKPRQVLITYQQYLEMAQNQNWGAGDGN